MKKAKARRSEVPLVDAVIRGMQEVKGRDVVHLDLRGSGGTAFDHFIICHGDSDRQVEALARSVEKVTLELTGEKPWHVEGQEGGQWILLDYVDVVVHIFHKDRRAFYDLEQLWSDAVRNTYENVA
ncbi:MAG: ribosome silencing factor [Flavobacteriales bacterium]